MEPESIGLALEISKLLVAIAGAIFVAWYWNRRKHLLEEYRYLDESYNALLQMYFDHPQYGDPKRTANYAKSFKGKEAIQYHYFAMRVHTLMETVFDVCKGKVSDEWQYVFRHHTALHMPWLKKHRELHEPGYVEEALRG